MAAGWRRAACLVITVLALAGCRGGLAPPPDCPGDPDEAIMELMDAWQRAPCYGLYEADECNRSCESGVRSKEFIRRQAENLLFKYPRHTPTRFFAALLAYEAGDPIRATEHLDTLLEIQPVHAEAALLRARIATEDGNILFAQKLLREQVALRPNDANLHEALASAYFMNDEYHQAVASLDTADRLGGRQWRIAYNRGLIEESRGDTTAAIEHYKSAVAKQPTWQAPKRRLEALEKGVTENTPVRGFPSPDQRWGEVAR